MLVFGIWGIFFSSPGIPPLCMRVCVCVSERARACERGSKPVIPCPPHEPLILSHMLYSAISLVKGLMCGLYGEQTCVPNVCQ